MVIIAFGSAVAGALAGAVAAFIFELVKVKKEYSKVRSAIKVEINRNGAKLREFWQSVDRDPVGAEMLDLIYETIEIPNSNPILRIFDIEQPLWSLKIWENHSAEAALALNENQFNQVYQFYENLAQITAIYLKLKNLVPDAQREKRNELWRSISSLILNTNELERTIQNI